MSKEDQDYYDNKFPKTEWDDGVRAFVWQCAYSGALDGPQVLRHSVWVRLSNYDRLDRTYSRKYYDSADRAIEDLNSAINAGEKT